MPRTLNATLEDALDSGNFQPYLLLTVREVGASVIHTATPVSFKLSGIEMEVKWLHQNNTIYDGYSRIDNLEFKLTRGVTIAGANYTLDSSWYFGVSQNWNGIFQSVKASMLPHTRYSAAGDGTYQSVIDALCTNYSKTAVYDNTSAAWKSYQFLPTGKTLILNRASDFLTLLKQKRLIFACDNGNDEIRFQSVATTADLHASTDHTIQVGRFKTITDIVNHRQFLSRDENNTISYSGDTDSPIWNLGFVKSTDAKPNKNSSFPVALEPIAPHLKYLSFDATILTFENWPDISYISVGIPSTNVIEEYDFEHKEIKWRIYLSNFDWARGTEGGALPGTIEAAAPYTPLNTSNFNNNLDATVNNIQTLADRVDDLDLTGEVSPADIREKLTAARTYYVRTDGSDSNTGLVDSAAGAFLTVQKAVDTVYSIDTSIYDVTIQIKDGTYTGQISLPAPFIGKGTVSIKGNATTPANVVISTAGNAFAVSGGCTVTIRDLKITTSSGHGITANSGAFISITNLDFGACASNHIFITTGALLNADGNYSITGNAARHWESRSGGNISVQAKTVTLTGTPAFSTAFAQATIQGTMVVQGNTFSGSATGKRYDSISNSVIYTNGGGATYLPGNSAGTTATGGIYV